MDNCPAKLSSIAQLFPEYVSDTKSRFWHIGNRQSLSRTDIICPQPQRASRASYALDIINRVGSKPNGILLTPREDCAVEILDIILNKDDLEGDFDRGNQMSFFCGSPPVRANNPVVRDAQFSKLANFGASPLSNFRGENQRSERGSPSRGSPKVRIEGFACGASDSHCIVPALA